MADDWQPPGDTVSACIASWAAVTPDARALLGIAGPEFTYAELWAFMNHVRDELAAAGIGRTERVVLALPDGVVPAAMMLATMRAAVATPVNPALPLPEAQTILDSLTPRALIVPVGMPTAFCAAAAASGIAVLEIDEHGFLLPGPVTGSQPTAFEAEPDPDDLALILLTSGTTDRPRRVPVRHRSLLDVCTLRARARKLSPADRGLNSAPASFVVGISRTIEPLITGGSTVVVTGADLLAFPEAVSRLRPTWAWFAPALLESIVTAAERHSAFKEWPLRAVRVGGGRLPADLAARAEALWGAPPLIGYGTTEVLGYIAAEEEIDRFPRKPGSVGQVRPELSLVIRSPEGEALATGEPGEITVQPGDLFSGYLDDPEATAAVFFDGGWYRTGDLGYLDADGYLFVTGRVREMINRGGQKIAPHEIDDALRAHPDVADAAAFGLPDKRLGEDVAAAVVVRNGAETTALGLRHWVAERLAPHKIPHKIWFVPELPRTASGKIQRGALTTRFQDEDG